jgi:hypothetical protein
MRDILRGETSRITHHVSPGKTNRGSYLILNPQ